MTLRQIAFQLRSVLKQFPIIKWLRRSPSKTQPARPIDWHVIHCSAGENFFRVYRGDLAALLPALVDRIDAGTLCQRCAEGHLRTMAAAERWTLGTLNAALWTVRNDAAIRELKRREEELCRGR